MIKRILVLLIVNLICFTVSAQTLHLYGGSSHKTYLGCLNCNNYDSNSIWNEYGTYGSSYNTNSIWNEYGTYGGEYSQYSPFNSYAQYPPAIVDKEGNFYGYLTVNTMKQDRATFDLALIICKYHKQIKKDVSGWYKKIFK